MGEEFQQHARNFRHARFGIGAVPELATAPKGFIERPDVVHDLGLDNVGVVAAQGAVFAVGVFFIVVRQARVDGQRAHDRIVEGGAGIGVEGERKVERNVVALLAGFQIGAVGERVHPQAARHIVVVVVGRAAVAGIDGVVETGPLEPVAGSFGKAGVARGFRLERLDAGFDFERAAGDVAHAAAEFHGIGRHHGAAVAQVGEENALVLEFSLDEAEATQVDPGTAAHLLVDAEAGRAARVAHFIDRGGRTAGNGMIGDVDGIFARLRNPRNPGGCRAAFGIGVGHPGGTHPERVLLIKVGGFRIGEARVGGILPDAGFEVAGARFVVVHDHFVYVPVAFPGQQHIGAGVLEHRHEERDDVALGVEVFHRLEDAGALPFPTRERLLIIPAMALPHRDVPVLQAFRGLVGRGEPADQRSGEFVVVLAGILAVFLGRLRRGRLAEIAAAVEVDGLLVGIQLDFLLVLFVFLGERRPGDVVEVLDVLVAERMVHQGAAERQPQGAVFQDGGLFDGDVAAHGRLFAQVAADGVGHRDEVLVAGGTGLRRDEQGEDQEEGKKGISHGNSEVFRLLSYKFTYICRNVLVQNAKII